METEMDNFRIKNDKDLNDVHKRVDDTLYSREHRGNFTSSHLSYKLNSEDNIRSRHS